MKYLGDIIVVEHINQLGYESKILELPQDVKDRTGLSRARVIGIGEGIRRKAKKYYPQDDLHVNDIVLVPTHLGSRNRIKNNPKAIIYDGEDILAVEE